MLTRRPVTLRRRQDVVAKITASNDESGRVLSVACCIGNKLSAL